MKNLFSDYIIIIKMINVFIIIYIATHRESV